MSVMQMLFLKGISAVNVYERPMASTASVSLLVIDIQLFVCVTGCCLCVETLCFAASESGVSDFCRCFFGCGRFTASLGSSYCSINAASRLQAKASSCCASHGVCADSYDVCADGASACTPCHTWVSHDFLTALPHNSGVLWHDTSCVCPLCGRCLSSCSACSPSVALSSMHRSLKVTRQMQRWFNIRSTASRTASLRLVL